MPQAASTRGFTTPQPPHSIQPSPLQVRQAVLEAEHETRMLAEETVDVSDANGTGEPQGIVCGAHNFQPGDLVVVVLPGGVLPGGFAISARKTYGHVSAGMICSAHELGLGEDHDGIMVLPADAGSPRSGSSWRTSTAPATPSPARWWSVGS